MRTQECSANFLGDYAFAAYSVLYLDCARKTLGSMLDFAVNILGTPLPRFFDLFIASGCAERFQHGEPDVIAGRSGVELAFDVLEAVGIKTYRSIPIASMGRSPEYWLGWALAYYQWFTNQSFEAINSRVPVSVLLDMYWPYHEMDILQFVDAVNELLLQAQPKTNLKRLRKRANLSQSALANASDVPVRTIQQYEQRQKDINKAQAQTLARLANALDCRIEDLMEPNIKGSFAYAVEPFES